MQPYQQASERIKEQMKDPVKFGKAAISTAGSILTGSTISRAIPLLNEFVPFNLMKKGLNKINKKIGEFVEESLMSGYSRGEAQEYLEKVMPQKKKAKSFFEEIVGDFDLNALPEENQQELNFLRMVSDDLQQKGKERNDPSFKKLEKKIKSALKGKLGLAESEALRFQQAYPQAGQQVQPQAQPGSGQQALMAILQKIQAQRGGGIGG